jgi:multiple sugar transport system ATP-binding protein
MVARIVIEHLTKTFRGREGATIRALDDFNLVLEDGELVVLVGPSGSGKTTALRLIAGLDQPSSGTLSLDGAPILGISARDREVAMVFQTPALYPHMTVQENLGFGLTVRKCPRGERERRVEEIAEILGLGDCLGRLPAELSGGQSQRVALGRAIVRKPKVLLLDEPLSNLDARLRAEMRLEISRLHRRLGATVLYVTHDQSEALTLGQRVAVMRAGRLEQVDQPGNIYRRPATQFVAEFIGAHPMNLFHADLKQDQDQLVFLLRAGEPNHSGMQTMLHLPFTAHPELATFVGKPMVVGFRPEAISQRAASTPSEPGFKATLEAVETSGPETYLLFHCKAQRVLVRAGNASEPRVGDTYPLTLDTRQVHFFDPATGRAIVCAS